MNELITIEAAAELIRRGVPLSLAGPESALDQLPAGPWIGGTIPYFMVAGGGTVVTEGRVFATDLSSIGSVRFASYGPDELAGIAGNAPEHGFALAIIPAGGRSHANFAANAANYPDAFLKPTVGWIAGMHLSDLGRATPKVYDGRTAARLDGRAVVAYVTLPPEALLSIEIVNLFAPVFAGVDYHFAKPLADYATAFRGRLADIDPSGVVLGCNCILNFMFGQLEGQAIGGMAGPATFGEIAYQLLNQTMVMVRVQ
jgi:hypothetical protein